MHHSTTLALGVAAIAAIAIMPAQPGTAASAMGTDIEPHPCGTSPEDPCPAVLERPCDADGAADPCDCRCGEGWWSRRTVSIGTTPAVPWDSGPQVTTVNLTTWRWNGTASAFAGHAEASYDLTGYSALWHAGSMTKSVSAAHSTTEREEWEGTGAPCPRLVHVAAMGGAMIELSLTCSATAGTGASGSVSIAGACKGPGNASAQLDTKSVNGTAAYSQLSHNVVAAGKLGTTVDDDGFGIDGRISREVQWKLQGNGVATGTAAYVVMPDRSYCAFTNRPLTLRSSGSVAVSIGATVDDNGSTSASAFGLVALRVV